MGQLLSSDVAAAVESEAIASSGDSHVGVAICQCEAIAGSFGQSPQINLYSVAILACGTLFFKDLVCGRGAGNHRLLRW